MLPFRRIAGFFCRLFLIYGFLVAPWPGINAGYAALFSAGGNQVFRSIVPGGSVRFHPVPPPAGKFDTHVHLANLRSGGTMMYKISSRDPAYLQTTLLTSLVLATPLPWRRRLWALLLGMILVNVAIVCKLLVTVLHGFSSTRVALLDPSPPWDKVLAVAYDFAVGDVVMLLMLPVFIWILVCFRQSDWRM